MIMHIVMYVYEDFTPFEVFGVYNLLSKLPDATVDLVAEKSGVVYADDKNISLNIPLSIAKVDKADVLIVPGSTIGWTQQIKNKKVLAWLRKIDATSKYTLGVCTGSIILGASGVLKGKKATTFWLLSDFLADYGIKFVDKPIVQDGKYMTAEAAVPGMELIMQIIKRISDEKTAQVTQLMLGYDAPQSRFEYLKKDEDLTQEAAERLLKEGKKTLPLLTKITNAKFLMRVNKSVNKR